MAEHTGISEARRRLFELVDRVLDHPDEAVYIEHRDRPQRVALVSEARLESLERRAARGGLRAAWCAARSWSAARRSSRWSPPCAGKRPVIPGYAS